MSPAHQLFTDGGARGNPGPAGIGAVLLSPDGEVVDEISEGIGWATNNVAEYRGLIEGLKLARRHDVTKLHVKMDSLLVVEQMKGVYRVKHAGLKPLHAEAQNEVGAFDEVSFEAIPRSANSRADALVNEGIDRWSSDNPRFEKPDPAQPGLF